MRIRQTSWAVLAMVVGLSGCGDHNNFFGSLADENSIEAKVQEAQIALDRGDCQTAINGFTAGFINDPNDVDMRIKLAAAYACRAGFNVTELIRVGADFVASGDTADQFNLFKAIADAAVNLVSATWDADTTTAISFLTDTSLPPTGGCNPAPFAYNPDAAFNQAIIYTIRGVMAVTTLQNLATGVILTGNITPAVAGVVGDALRDADNGITCSNSIIGGSIVVDSDLAEAISELHQSLNGLDGDLDNTLAAAELQQYLDDQGFVLQ